jgi:dTDP-4-amino-4,6-dideoxygalactose transaminase
VARPRLPSAAALLPYLERIDEARWYSNFGPLLKGFEQRLTERFGAEAAVTTAVNATQLITLTLHALDLPAGSLVAIPSWTFVATAHAVLQAGLVPWFLDVGEETAMLDPGQVHAALGRAPGPVSAVIPVCAHGAMPDVDAWLAFQAETGLPVILDAAAAFDAACDARLPTIVSLHATKVVGIGEGGFLATEDKALALRVRQLTTYGFRGIRESEFVATNAKLSEYAAAVGHAALDAWPADRLRFCLSAQLLRAAFAATPDVVFQPGWGTEWATSVCVVRTPGADALALAASLAEAGVETRFWWGDGCHRARAFQGYPRDDLAVTERLARTTLGLPFAVDLTVADANRVALAVQHGLRQLPDRSR